MPGTTDPRAGADFSPFMIVRAAITRSATFVVVAGLLLQLVLGPLWAVPGGAALAVAGWPNALCTSGSTGGSIAHGHETDPPVSPHQCDACLVCLLHADAPGLLPAAARIQVVAAHSEPLRWVISATPPGARPFRLYSSRAPPAVV